MDKGNKILIRAWAFLTPFVIYFIVMSLTRKDYWLFAYLVIHLIACIGAIYLWWEDKNG